MFGRARSEQELEVASDDHAFLRYCEVERLRADVARLEQALVEVTEALDDVLTTVHAADVGPNGFAAAWSRRDLGSQNQADVTFFSIAQVDQRARRWLLTSN